MWPSSGSSHQLCSHCYSQPPPCGLETILLHTNTQTHTHISITFAGCKGLCSDSFLLCCSLASHVVTQRITDILKLIVLFHPSSSAWDVAKGRPLLCLFLTFPLRVSAATCWRHSVATSLWKRPLWSLSVVKNYWSNDRRHLGPMMSKCKRKRKQHDEEDCLNTNSHWTRIFSGWFKDQTLAIPAVNHCWRMACWACAFKSLEKVKLSSPVKFTIVLKG